MQGPWEKPNIHVAYLWEKFRPLDCPGPGVKIGEKALKRIPGKSPPSREGDPERGAL